MNRAQIQALLNKIKSNSELLTQIDHMCKTNWAHIHDDGAGRLLSSIQTAKLIVQLSYLLYTCSILKADIYISTKILFVKKYSSQFYEPRLIFFLRVELPENSLAELCNECSFILFRSQKFKEGIGELIQNLWQQSKQKMESKNGEEFVTRCQIEKFIEYQKKYISPQMLNGSQVSVIKQYQKQQLFINNSDLLKAYNNSILYRIKKNKKVQQQLKGVHLNIKNRIFHLPNITNPNLVIKELDTQLFLLIIQRVLFMDKSSNSKKSQRKQLDKMEVGQVKIQQNNGMHVSKYSAKVYTFQGVSEDKKGELQGMENEKNIYTIEFVYQTGQITVKYISKIQAHIDTIDIISFHSANISLCDPNISIQTVDIVRNPIKGNVPKKYVAFKNKFFLEKNQEPFFRILVAIEHITLCALIYFPLMDKKPTKYQSSFIQQLRGRLNHLIHIFVYKAQSYYLSL